MSEISVKKRWTIHAALLILGIAIFCLFFIKAGDQSLRHILHLNWFPFLLAVLAGFGKTYAAAVKWGMITNACLGHKKISWFEYFYYLMLSRAGSFILPKDMADIGGRILSISQLKDTSVAKISTSVILDRIFDLLFLIFILLTVLPFWFGYVHASAAILIGLGLICFSFIILSGLNEEKFQVFTNSINSLIKTIQKTPWLNRKQLQGSNENPIHKDLIIKIYFMYIIKYVFMISQFILFSRALNLSIPPHVIILGMPIIQLSFLIAFAPGGLGIMEAGWFAILILGGVTTADTSIFVVGQRVLLMLSITLLTVLTQIIFIFRRIKKIS